VLHDRAVGSDHNKLTDLQGGNSTERYHLDKDQYDAINESEHNPSGENPFVTQSELEIHLSNPLTVQLGDQVSLGGVTTGDSFTTENKLEDVLRAILIKRIQMIPFCRITTNVVEVGSTITIIYTSYYNQADGGANGTYSLLRNGVLISNSNPYAETYTFSSSNVIYNATQQYANGPIINDNLGDPTPNPILAGTTSSSYLTVTPKRRLFFGTNPTIPTTSDNVRALGQSEYTDNIYADQLIFNITIQPGAKSVIFAIPSTRSLVSVILNVGLTSDETSTFQSNTSTINVEGAGHYSATPYTQYWYTPVGTFTSTCIYTVTIQ